MAAGLEPPQQVFGHGFVYRKNEETGVEKISKTLGNVVEPMDIITKFSAEAFRYYFLRECPFPGDGEFSWQRFAEVYNADLANNLGNLYSRVVTLITKNYDGDLAGTAGVRAGRRSARSWTPRRPSSRCRSTSRRASTTRRWRRSGGRSSTRPISTPTRTEPWKLVKTDKEAAKQVLFDLVGAAARRRRSCSSRSCRGRRRRSTAASTSRSRGSEVRYEDVWVHPRQIEDLRVLAKLEDGKVKPLFPRIN